ncbi:DnaD domain-containing protein [Gracilibacillus alcaliphilus]|uniref:DnaD domain-containing protein n=1 Tax=Gracilibacillus alcaliphilus TaxID=1401441 RepID=UPI0019582772|nr:DnaD domain-containing protein [Gracilibacillus alcaliphilus]MBM7675221.1 DNA replication protein [Gracilibacillus alcaliphilus]
MKDNLQRILLDQISLPAELIRNYTSLSINETQLSIILQIFIAQRNGDLLPTPEEIAKQLTISSHECSELLRQLIQRNLLRIEEQQDNHMITESYSLDPLWEQLYRKKEEKTDASAQKIGEVFKKFEQEFGRILSPFEIDMINNWLDEDRYDLELIYAALREAVLMGKLNFKYIDRILIEWKKKGIKSVQQAQESSKAFRQHQPAGRVNRQEDNRYDKSLYYNWLEE